MPKAPEEAPDIQSLVEASRDQILRNIQSHSERDLLCAYRRFIPRSSLRDILTRHKVESHLSLSLPDAELSIRLAAQIAPEGNQKCHCQKDACTGGRIIFASLLRIGREDYIQCVIDQSSAKLCDSTLPLKADELQVQPGIPKLSGKEWQLLENAQWQIRSHYLSSLSLDVDKVVELDDGAALPLTDIRNISVQEDQVGSSHKVSRVTIHSGHHQLDYEQGGGSDVFVLKTFRHSDFPGLAEADFKAELRANQQAPQHDRIVPLLTAFKFGDGFHLIFPYATDGDLHNLWRTFNVSDDNHGIHWYSPRWLLTQCCGIAEALVAMHQPNLNDNARWVPQLHADIKSNNILCFRDARNEFCLKLADFGISRTASDDLTLDCSHVEHTNTYRPPEYDTEERISLKYDVWSLGCLYLEFITWAISGYNAIDTFSRQRLSEKSDKRTSKAKGGDTEDTFFKKLTYLPSYDLSGLRIRAWRQSIEVITRNTTRSWRSFRISRGELNVSCKIKDSVKEHIKNLQTKHRLIAEFLKITETKMLVVEVDQRASSSEVARLLQNLSDSGL
ncbi:hypothetical protein O1611_g4672 [Lasiodiplodia mahajangana]|uniref:Uncharacterized protein n=1 Tax=Lasiodiplodia mahajangana TaxID=1108764 RepID=A0ACC2JN70_9PEZI|nr:hypothetical protein O1611_g4672 [Lasiodiplodia mahajangana]